MPPPSEHHMEGRLQKVESRLDGMEGSIAALSKNLSDFRGDVSAFMARQDASKPPSYTTILSTVIATGTAVGMLVAALFFLIDARVSSAVHESTSFTQEWKKDGRLYVTLYDLNQRVTTIEKQLSWKAELVAIQPSSPSPPPIRR